MEWYIAKTRTLPTVKIKKDSKTYYMHSKYDPIKEAETWVDKISLKETINEIIVIGIGLGYHISLLAKKYPNCFIQVFEFNYSFIKWGIERNKFTNLIENKNVFLNYASDTSALLNQLSKHLIGSIDNLLIYKPSLELIESNIIRLSLESYLIKKRTIREQKAALTQNFNKNNDLKDKDISSCLGIYNNSPTILVSAGPSLTKQLPLLKKASMRGAKIVCVGTALIPLIKADIIPNLIMISDPKDLIMDQFQGMKNLDVPLFYLCTANHTAVKIYNGPRFIVWQRGFPNAELIARQNKVPLIETGGSVATCLLDLLVKLGSNKIALVGQDLAFTNNMTHAIGTHLYKRFNHNINSIEVNDYYVKEKIITSRNLYIYLKWFESYVEQYQDIQFWNCTEGGAHIKGWVHRPLSEFLIQNKILKQVNGNDGGCSPSLA
ncbi:motility associated factor glycosyltransferase family protein [Fictibacillus sp. 7GRE50]|uniref:motility associated factor glycosyltransferase family protein n=1 Tax=Fictibacillus sp. 7GRE50 TaxID=2745878 RepID=UPI0018CF6FBB|nr:6-hydroxymethylpterin diphosphokinase MptE-like protein [Fictibacillus sp. 7GRE50]MBH0164045.1 motility associated factor glycosyltransferase family protein [Fictibacillus sp. 7GRE50]